MEQLLEMPFDEVLDLMPSRIRRSFVRGLNEEQKTAFDKIKASEAEVVRTHRRDIPIIPQFVGKKVASLQREGVQGNRDQARDDRALSGRVRMTRKIRQALRTRCRCDQVVQVPAAEVR